MNVGFPEKETHEHKVGNKEPIGAAGTLTVVTIVEPRLFVVVTGTPEGLGLEGKAVAVVTKVDPRESVVVIAIPPSTRPPIVEVMLRPAESVPGATKMLAVLTGTVSVTVDGCVVAEASLLWLAET